MRCSKCHHILPPHKRTWAPRWELWGACDGKRWTYVADGPPLGYLCRVSAKPAYWAAYAVECDPERQKTWPGWIEIGQGTAQTAKKLVEDYIRQNKYWARAALEEDE